SSWPEAAVIAPLRDGRYLGISCRSRLSMRAGLNSAIRPLLPITPILGTNRILGARAKILRPATFGDAVRARSGPRLAWILLRVGLRVRRQRLHADELS